MLNLLIKSESNKFNPTYKNTKINHATTHILKNNNVKKRGIISHIGEIQTKCLKNIIMVRIKGIIKKRYILLVEYQIFDKLFINFDIKKKLFTLLSLRLISI